MLTMHTASSACCTWSALLSGSENTATVRRPRRLQVLMMRHAISPLFAIKTLSNDADEEYLGWCPSEQHDVGADTRHNREGKSFSIVSIPTQ